MDRKRIHMAYSVVFWAALFSAFELSLQVGVFKISTNIVSIILLILGTRDLYRETKNLHFKAAAVGAWAMAACYAVFFVLDAALLDELMLLVAKLMSVNLLLIWVFSQILVGSGALLPSASASLKKTADWYAVLMCVITLALMALALINGNMIVAIGKFFVQIWMMVKINDCRRKFSILPDETDGSIEESAK